MVLSQILHASIKASPIVTVLGVFIALFTLFEMRRQRQKSYEPQLFFANMTFYLQKNMDGTPCILKSSFEKANSLHSGPFFSIEVFNIGLGSANTITIKWLYDQKRLIKRFAELGEQAKLLSIDKNGYFKYQFGESPEQVFGSSLSSIEESKREVSFLSANQSTAIRMPDALFNYLTFLPYLELIKQGSPRRVDLAGKDFTALIEYYDVGGKRHAQKIKLTIEAFAFATEFSENNYGLGTITYTK